ncbi:hypothetical protein [Streptomyces prunicolor]|uniref:hypothetical protein n=1 Tax=Streptomyces prunicolor TaxID=67348 RepID=UPI00340F1F54
MSAIRTPSRYTVYRPAPRSGQDRSTNRDEAAHAARSAATGEDASVVSAITFCPPAERI